MAPLAANDGSDPVRELLKIGFVVQIEPPDIGELTEEVELTLGEARKLGLTRVLLTADSDNTGSIGVIEGNGGLMEDERHDGSGPYRRYWIELASS